MTRNVAVVRETDTLAFASQVLLWRAIRHLPILDSADRVVGILSDRDLLSHVLEGPAGSQPVRDFMTRTVETISEDMALAEASARLREHRVDALPVVERGALIGILTTSDILAERGRALRKANAGTTPRAADVMRRRVASVRAHDTLETAIVKLLDSDIRHLPVVDEDFRLVGILSDRDIRSTVGDPRRSLETEGGPEGTLSKLFVEDFMTKEPITVSLAASVLDVADIFVSQRIGAVPVVRDDDTLLGIISYVDVIAHFVGRPR
ncbi:MAG: CBS domain-containing protein [Polyangiaceae bacterium]|nr:CBS domain-containing protein [Polyangiaceae bacterium]